MFRRGLGRLRGANRRSKEKPKTSPAADKDSTTSAADQEDLCTSCTSVDLYNVLENRTEVTHSTLAEAASNVNCAFCQYVVTRARGCYGDLCEANQNMIVCILRYRQFASNPQCRKRNEIYRTNVQVEAKLTHQCPGTPCPGSSCSMNVNAIDTWYCQLDLLPIPPSIFSSADPPAIVRRSLDPTFQPGKLLNWLRDSDFDEFRQPPSANSGVNSLESLIRANRFRVLDTTSCTIVTLQSAARYMALSYVWGNVKQRPLTTQSESDTGHPSATQVSATFKDIEELPLSIQDAICLARQIGERYLWVDSLCIVQGDPEDKAVVIPEMGAIYGNAYFTIVAADGSDSNARLSRLVAGKAPEKWITMMTRRGHFHLSRARPLLEDAIAESSWNTRGWTFQERLHSRRCVLFTKHGVFFDSKPLRAGEAYELVPNAKPSATYDRFTFDTSHSFTYDAFESFQLNENGVFDTYISAVEEYTTRNFSYPGDRLDAFSGILRQLQPQTMSSEHIDALSGLLFKDFFASLLWYALPPWRQRRERLTKTTRLHLDARGRRHLPSWSWVGWEGRITMDPLKFDVPHDTNRHLDYMAVNQTGLPSITIVDAANIVCHTLFSPTDFQHRLCEATAPLQVTLHLWVKTWPCTLAPKAQHGSDTVYTVEPQGMKSEAQKSEHDENEVILPDGVDANSKFELLCLDDRLLHYILVREVDSFFERVGLVFLARLYQLSHETTVRYIRLR